MVRNARLARCILFHFYIKPQQISQTGSPDYVVSYSISTSNHNSDKFFQFFFRLYLIPFLHQTTTWSAMKGNNLPLYLIPFLHQTTTWSAMKGNNLPLYLIPFLHQTTTCICFIRRRQSCILFHFYIKPQQFF